MENKKGPDAPLFSLSVVLIGAGNLATALGEALFGAGISVLQVYSRTQESAELLAKRLRVPCVTRLEEVNKQADIYMVSLKDDAFVNLVPEITAIRPEALFVHTAGSIPIDIWEGHCRNYGVFYPLQTFRKRREVDIRTTPEYIEADRPETYAVLERLGKELSGKVRRADSAQRAALHLAAVFACNFTNYMYVAADRILGEHHLPFEVLLPLIEETARKVTYLDPVEAQTGPAVRQDTGIMDKHLRLLKNHPDLQELYQLISQGIYTSKL